MRSLPNVCSGTGVPGIVRKWRSENQLYTRAPRLKTKIKILRCEREKRPFGNLGASSVKGEEEETSYRPAGCGRRQAAQQRRPRQG